MENILSNLQIQVKEGLYLKKPESTTLGQKIISGSIDLINRIGFEQYTFRKLAVEIKSTEASIYRYFESKHQILLYLSSWYWSWMEYRLVFGLANIKSAEERLKISINLITERVVSDQSISHIDECKLHQIVICEFTKAYLNKSVDKVNQVGAYSSYKRLVERISDIVLEINPKYKYPHMLISTTIEGAHLQSYFADHLPRLTDVVSGENSVKEFYTDVVFKSILS
jgi:AcrR family transcriptional regulator